jgi:hypothetical protein
MALDPPNYNAQWVDDKGRLTPYGQRWLSQLHDLIGTEDGFKGAAETLTGVITSANLAVGLAPNVTNDALAEAVDVDASTCEIVVHGGAAGAYDTTWAAYQDGAVALKLDGVTPLSGLAPQSFPTSTTRPTTTSATTPNSGRG